MTQPRNWDILPPAGNPDFKNLLKVLDRKKPDRPTLFEFFLNERLYGVLAGQTLTVEESDLERHRVLMKAFCRAGYDYTTVSIPGFTFPIPGGDRHKEQTVSLNEGAAIRDWATFQAYPWPDPDHADLNFLTELEKDLPDGMKLMVCGPGGVIENATWLVGYEALCTMIFDDPRLTEEVFAEVGSRLVRFYELASKYDCVGLCISNDDWGFKTQTQFSPRDMRRFVFPWHKKIVDVIHQAGKPAVLHSCGHFERVIDDIIDDMGYDGRHSYEDAIMPVEEAYDRYHQRIAILGGIDVDLMVRGKPEDIYARSLAMLDRSAQGGSYALGTGNSVPFYIPDSQYNAMISAALDRR